MIFQAIGARSAKVSAFQTLHEHHALLVEHHGTQRQLFGEADTEYQTARKSFFRRLHEAKRPDLAIDFEVVLCMVKPHAGLPPDEAWQQMPLVKCCVSSPPYVHSVHDGNGIDQTKFKAMSNGQRETPGKHTQAEAEGYGQTSGQLGIMREGSLGNLLL